tara:strand:+ start:1100 stop:1789 length:690 start_codon:yes stop_codon:yes gene_type:complete
MSSELATKKPEYKLIFFNDAADQDDLNIPWIQIFQSSSTYSIDGEDPEFGSITIDKRCLLAAPNTPLEVIPLQCEKFWFEETPFNRNNPTGSENKVYTKEEMHELKKSSQHKVQEAANITMLIKHPESVDPTDFQMRIGDDHYGIFKIRVQKLAYKNVFKTLYTYQKFNPQGSLHDYVWSLSTHEITGGVTYHTAMISKAKRKGKDGKDEFFAPSKSVLKYLKEGILLK